MISHDIYYCTAQYISQPITSVYKIHLNEVLGVYKHGGFDLTEVHCNNEFHDLMNIYSIKQDPTI